MHYIVVHYSELATKGKNRDFFERKLIQNIESALGKSAEKVYKRYGKIICDLKGKCKEDEIRGILEKLPGIAYFSFAAKAELELKDIEKKSLEVLKNEEFETFKVVASRSNKNFKLNSMDLNKKIGEVILEKMNKKVIMKNPDRKVFVEIGEKEAFVYCKKNYGIGGLPIGTAGKVISSLSGGIDSPVASFLMMKRGCEVVFMHAFNKTMTEQGVKSKLEELVKQLAKFQLKAKLYIVPFDKIQQEIIGTIPSKQRMIVYRRFMTRIANEIAKKENAKAVVTGDSVGQVASQTLENLECIYDASDLPIFPPLIGMNKEEIVDTAKKIGTYELSIQPYPDCCSFMIAEHPETKGRIEEIARLEGFIKNREQLTRDAISNAKILRF